MDASCRIELKMFTLAGVASSSNLSFKCLHKNVMTVYFILASGGFQTFKLHAKIRPDLGRSFVYHTNAFPTRGTSFQWVWRAGLNRSAIRALSWWMAQLTLAFFLGSKCTPGQKIPKPDRCNVCDCDEGHIVCTNFECRPIHKPSSAGNINKPVLRRYRKYWATVFWCLAVKVKLMFKIVLLIIVLSGFLLTGFVLIIVVVDFFLMVSRNWVIIYLEKKTNIFWQVLIDKANFMLSLLLILVVYFFIGIKST